MIINHEANLPYTSFSFLFKHFIKHLIPIPTAMIRIIPPTIIAIITPIASVSASGMGIGSLNLQICVLFSAEMQFMVVGSLFRT